MSASSASEMRRRCGYGEQHEGAHVEELAPPILEYRLHEVSGRDVLEVADGLLSVVGLLLVVLAHPGEAHEEQGQAEQPELHRRQAVVAQCPLNISIATAGGRSRSRRPPHPGRLGFPDLRR
jgi:hypothetical protein